MTANNPPRRSRTQREAHEPLAPILETPSPDLTASVQTPESGWYADPQRAGQLRWWSGEAWTNAVREPQAPVLRAPKPLTTQPNNSADAASIENISAPAGAAEYAWSREASERKDITANTRGMSAASAFRATQWSARSKPTSPHTVSVWMIAFIPYVQLVTTVAVLVLLSAGEMRLITVSIVFYLLTFLLAIRDSTVLRRLGYDRPPQSAWALLGPLAYLIARTVAIKRELDIMTSPLWVWIFNVVVCACLAAGLALTIGRQYLQLVGLVIE